MVLMCRMTFILPIVAGKRRLAFNPRDGHLARHRPVAGVLLDDLLFGHDLFRKPDSTFRDHDLVQANEMRLHLESHDLIGKPEPLFRTMRKNARDMRA